MKERKLTLEQQAVEALIGGQTASDAMMRLTKEERDYLLIEVTNALRQVQAEAYEDAVHIMEDHYAEHPALQLSNYGMLEHQSKTVPRNLRRANDLERTS